MESFSKGGKALDAVEKGVRLVEDDPTERSVGYGGRPDRDGRVTLDACIMDENYNIGSVACMEHIKNPISVARAVMEKHPCNVSRRRSFGICVISGIQKRKPSYCRIGKRMERMVKTSQYKPIVNIENHDTIGMIALDAQGNLSGACTTSGMAL